MPLAKTPAFLWTVLTSYHRGKPFPTVAFVLILSPSCYIKARDEVLHPVVPRTYAGTAGADARAPQQTGTYLWNPRDVDRKGTVTIHFWGYFQITDLFKLCRAGPSSSYTHDTWQRKDETNGGRTFSVVRDGQQLLDIKGIDAVESSSQQSHMPMMQSSICTEAINGEIFTLPRLQGNGEGSGKGNVAQEVNILSKFWQHPPP